MRADFHTHTHKSNIQHRDSTNFESQLIDRAIELGLKGIALTDHGCLSSHIDALLHMKKIKNDDFKLCLGTEIYLVGRNTVAEAREKNEPTKFYHLILVAKNKEGYRALAELSSNSWEEAFHYRGVMRVPTYKEYFQQWAIKNRGNIMVTSACLGSEFSNLVLEFAKNNTPINRNNIEEFLRNMVELFGEDYYIEIQPSHFEEQIIYNKLALQIAEAYGIKVLINTDAHYLSEDMKEIHSIYLKSQNAERETEQFYASAYLMGEEELRSYFPYVNYEKFNEIMNNSIVALDKIEKYDLHHETDVPQTTIKFDTTRISSLAPYFMDIEMYNKYPYIPKFGMSSYEIDKILLQQIELGLETKNIRVTEEVLNRINEELESVWEVSEKLGSRLASYYLLTKEIVELMWLVSLVGVSRGSAGAFYICYLLDITQIDPIEHNLPHWRHIDKNKIELAKLIG